VGDKKGKRGGSYFEGLRKRRRRGAGRGGGGEKLPESLPLHSAVEIEKKKEGPVILSVTIGEGGEK